MTEAIPPASRQDIIQMVVTEHFTLQAARSAAISDANGRTSFFLGTLSAVVVALAFVAQVSQLGQAFLLFALVLLPMLLFVGLAIFERLLQLGVENIRAVIAINRLRHYYLEVAPELSAHFTLSPHDDPAGVLLSLGSWRTRVRPWDLVISNAGMVAVLDSLIGAVTAGLAAWALGWGLGGATIAAALGGVAMLAVLFSYMASTWRQAQRVIGSRFPGSGAALDVSHVAPAAPTASEAPDRPA